MIDKIDRIHSTLHRLRLELQVEELQQLQRY